MKTFHFAEDTVVKYDGKETVYKAGQVYEGDLGTFNWISARYDLIEGEPTKTAAEMKKEAAAMAKAAKKAEAAEAKAAPEATPEPEAEVAPEQVEETPEATDEPVAESADEATSEVKE